MSNQYATTQATESYAKRFSSTADPSYFTKQNGLFLSSVGIGTYLGEMDAETDLALLHTLNYCVPKGINVIDTAINYRGQRSERIIGKALSHEDRINRDEIFISTKGGFIPFDTEYPHDPSEFFSDAYIKTGILEESDVIQGCHAMTPKFLEHQLKQSLNNLNTKTIDLYYVHNPEIQLEEITQHLFYERLTDVFRMLEKKVAEGKIKNYGLATWNGFRVSSKAKIFLSLNEILEAACEAGGEGHHFKGIQLPYNLGMPEALTTLNQAYNGEHISTIEYAKRSGLMVFVSASLLQGRLASELPAKIKLLFPGCVSQATCALQFVRSTPGVTTALVGMKNEAHVDENLSLKALPRLEPNVFFRLFQEHP